MLPYMPVRRKGHEERRRTTGKAAYGIKGNTVHSALAIPACQSLKTYKPLDSSRLNTLRCKLRAVQLIFLDEISMIGNAMLNAEREIAPNTGANATKFFTLATKSLKLVAKLVTRMLHHNLT